MPFDPTKLELSHTSKRAVLSLEHEGLRYAIASVDADGMRVYDGLPADLPAATVPFDGDEKHRIRVDDGYARELTPKRT